jgi:predicted ribosome quality control (RQC) complex YloA/Tae2 family protein
VHQNYYFLKQLSVSLADRLQSAVISECFSQTKEELVIRFETHTRPFFIRTSLLAEFSTLSFPDDFQRAKKNSVDLFPALIGQRVQSIRQFTNERAFSIVLTNDLHLIFKMHGNRSNIILVEHEKVVALFKQNIKGDFGIVPAALDREIDWSFEAFQQSHDAPQKLYYTFGKHVWQYLQERGSFEKNIDEQWHLIQMTRQQLERCEFFIVTQGKPLLTLLPPDTPPKKFTDPIKAANEFYYAFTQVYILEKERGELISRLRSAIGNSHSYITKTSSKLQELERDDNFKVWGDLVMANLHALKTGQEKAVLQNFYDNNKPIEIKLKKDLSPQKNAEVFYRKGKNQQIELDHLKSALTEKQRKIDEMKDLIVQIEGLKDVKSLRSIAGKMIFKNDEKDNQSLPYHEFEHRGFRILVGRNAESNDVLTQQLSYKEDLWLHAKDVSGSHVIIKYQSGKKFPKDVIERAAELAAYNSKRKNDSLCPVIVTPKKFVRKRKGDPAGAVVVEREDVIMVVPKL